MELTMTDILYTVGNYVFGSITVAYVVLILVIYLFLQYYNIPGRNIILLLMILILPLMVFDSIFVGIFFGIVILIIGSFVLGLKGLSE